MKKELRQSLGVGFPYKNSPMARRISETMGLSVKNKITKPAKFDLLIQEKPK